jgi:hypothetical protein
MATDMVESVADMALAFVIRLFKNNQTVDSFRRYYPLRPLPGVAGRWRQDEEFARQRLDGVNPYLLRLASEIPPNFPVTEQIVKDVLPAGTSLAQLTAEHRLFLLDYRILDGLQPVFGRFCTAPMCLFWREDSGRLMPLAIQLGQSPAEAPIIFTPRDDPWLWLLARTFVQSADGTYHEVVAHLCRTHLVMESIWVAAARSLPAQHPVFALLQPHFTGTLDINHKARMTMLAPGGPIDESLAIGAEGSLTLLELAYEEWDFRATCPKLDLERRGLADPELLPGYHYRDDALAMYGAICTFVRELLRLYYPDDAAVQADLELQGWAHELQDPAGARVKGLPLTDGRFTCFEDVADVVSRIIFNCSVEHAAVNNGQYDQLGWIPNTPGAMFLPPPRDRTPVSESYFVYALPEGLAVGEQLTLVHLLSKRSHRPLGTYPDTFFLDQEEARNAVDRFRARIEDIGRDIQARNLQLPVPYLYLQPWLVSRSIDI